METAPDISTTWRGETVKVVSGEYIVSFENAVLTHETAANVPIALSANFNDMTLQRLLARTDLSCDFVSNLGLPNVFKVRIPGASDAKRIEGQLRLLPGFLTVEPNYVGELSSVTLTDEYYHASQENTWQKIIKTNNSAAEGGAGWDYSTGSSSVVIAQLDSGVNYNHADLTQNMWTNTREIAGNNVDDDGNGYIDDKRGWSFTNATPAGRPAGAIAGDGYPLDDNGHGTNVAGVMGAAGNNGKGVAGVGWQTTILPVQITDYTNGVYVNPSDVPDPVDRSNTSGRPQYDNLIKGINYVAALVDSGINVKVINASFGFKKSLAFSDPGDNTQQSPSSGDESKATALKGVIDNVGAKGVLFVCAALNFAENEPDLANIDDGYYLPAGLNCANLVTVAGTSIESGHEGELTSFSNYGPNTVLLAAPAGVRGITSTGTTSNGIYTTEWQKEDASIPNDDLYGNRSYYWNKKPGVSPVTYEYGRKYNNGTSFATPIVSATAAMAFAMKPDLTIAAVIAALQNGVTPSTLLSNKTKSGGVLNVHDTLEIVSNASGFSKTMIGDEDGIDSDDLLIVRVKSSDSTKTEMVRNGIVFATVENLLSKKLGIFGLAGDDTITVQTGVNNAIYVNGGRGDDTLNGGGGNDTLIGDFGIDALYGNGGADSLDGSADNDYLDGGDSNDTLIGGKGMDTLLGGNNSDSLYGYEDADSINGGAGDDLAYGDRATTLASGAGNDTIDGSNGSDQIYGGQGNDLLIGNIGADSVYGDDGNDSLYAYLTGSPTGADGSIDALFGNAGTDSGFYNAGEGDSFIS